MSVPVIHHFVLSRILIRCIFNAPLVPFRLLFSPPTVNSIQHKPVFLKHTASNGYNLSNVRCSGVALVWSLGLLERLVARASGEIYMSRGREIAMLRSVLFRTGEERRILRLRCFGK